MKTDPTEPSLPGIPAGFLLVRHCESEANAGLPTPSPAVIRLTENGHRQAADLAEAIPERPDLIVVSPYLRTRETASPFIARHPETPVETWPVHEFTYLDIVRHAGTTEAERSQVVDRYWERCDPLGNDGGGAESFADFIGRVDDALGRLFERDDRLVVVFTHGYVIHAAGLRLAEPEHPVDAEFMAKFRASWSNHAPAHGEVRRFLKRTGTRNRDLSKGWSKEEKMKSQKAFLKGFGEKQRDQKDSTAANTGHSPNSDSAPKLFPRPSKRAELAFLRFKEESSQHPRLKNFSEERLRVLWNRLNPTLWIHR